MNSKNNTKNKFLSVPGKIIAIIALILVFIVCYYLSILVLGFSHCGFGCDVALSNSEEEMFSIQEIILLIFNILSFCSLIILIIQYWIQISKKLYISCWILLISPLIVSFLILMNDIFNSDLF